ncbi:TPA: hypothetical protein ACH3X3_007776 [Trebouxia sp. C0006]
MPAAAHGRLCIFLPCALAFIALSSPQDAAAAFHSPLEASFLASHDRSLLDTDTAPASSGIPEAVAVFPLTGDLIGHGNTSSSYFAGIGHNHTWVQDADAGIVLQCSKANTSRVELPAAPYGTQGPWAINLWFKPSSEYGTSFQYLYSHNSTQCYNYTACPYAANQIRLYYPETGHPAYGVIRALVKDSTDTSNRGSYTDSDGRVGVNYQSLADGPPAWGRHFLADGLWHMLTLSTLSNNVSGLQGYVMSLDGTQVAYQAADQFYVGANGSVFTGSDGGRPMQLDGQIVLCDHSDSTIPRNYDGALSHLSIYDNALNYSQVLALFHQGVNGSRIGSLTAAIQPLTQAAVKGEGMFQPYPELPPNTPSNATLASLPTPAAFSPLSDGSLMNDPLLDGGFMYSGGGINATFVEDPDTFGRTLQCTSGVGSTVWLTPVPYYATLDDGPVSFTINLWLKAGNTTGELFQYLFSHMGDPDGSEWGPNQATANIFLHSMT